MLPARAPKLVPITQSTLPRACFTASMAPRCATPLGPPTDSTRHTLFVGSVQNFRVDASGSLGAWGGRPLHPVLACARARDTVVATTDKRAIVAGVNHRCHANETRARRAANGRLSMATEKPLARAAVVNRIARPGTRRCVPVNKLQTPRDSAVGSGTLQNDDLDGGHDARRSHPDGHDDAHRANDEPRLGADATPPACTQSDPQATTEAPSNRCSAAPSMRGRSPIARLSQRFPQS
jgi:hypothetical protein